MEIKQTCNDKVPAESTLTMKWGLVMAFVLGFFGWLAVGSFSHENRITRVETKLETQLVYITQSLSSLQKTVEDIRQDQVRRNMVGK